MDQNEEIFARYMNDPAFQALVAQWLAADVYRRLGGTPSGTTKYPLAKKPRAQHYAGKPASAAIDESAKAEK